MKHLLIVGSLFLLGLSPVRAAEAPYQWRSSCSEHWNPSTETAKLNWINGYFTGQEMMMRYVLSSINGDAELVKRLRPAYLAAWPTEQSVGNVKVELDIFCKRSENANILLTTVINHIATIKAKERGEIIDLKPFYSESLPH